MLRLKRLVGVGTSATLAAHFLISEKTHAAAEAPAVGYRSPAPSTHSVVRNPSRATMPEEELRQIITKNQVTVNLKGATCHMNTFASNIPIEDSYAVVDGLGPAKDISLFGVFDGHSGGICSEFCRDHLFTFIQKDWRQTGKYTLSKEQFLAADKFFLNWALKARDGSGACVNVVQLQGKEVTVANAGDCRAVLGRQLPNGNWEAVALSRDHEISSNPDEKERLLREHPNEPDVIYHDRIKGHLQPTRGMGDGVYKQMAFYELRPRYVQQHGNDWHPPYSVATPDIVKAELTANGKEFLVVACDGLFQDLNNQQVVDVVAGHLKNPPEGKNPATSLVEAALVAASQHAFGSSWLTRITGGDSQESLSKLFASNEQRRRNVHDDVTVLVIFPDQEPKPKL